MNTRKEIGKLFAEFQTKVIEVALAGNSEHYDRLRMFLEGTRNTTGAKRTEKPAAKARKARRGPRHCGKCGSRKHDARNCKRKGKVAVLEVAKAA